VEILQFPDLRSSCHSRPWKILVNCQLFLAPLRAQLHCHLSFCHLFSIINSTISPSHLGSSLYSLGADATENSVSQHYFHCLALALCRGNVLTLPFHSNGCTRYILFPTIPLLLRTCMLRLLPNNGRFYGSIVLPLSKYAKIFIIWSWNDLKTSGKAATFTITYGAEPFLRRR
jgi:hypothetical protein